MSHCACAESGRLVKEEEAATPSRLLATQRWRGTGAESDYCWQEHRQDGKTVANRSDK